MELLLGSHVREHGNRVGRLAGLEFEPSTRQVRRIVFSSDGDTGPQAASRPLIAISHVHDNGEIELRADVEDIQPDGMPTATTLNRATRLKRSGHDQGRLVGVEVNPGDRAIVSVFGRRHWWSKRFVFARHEFDSSQPGELRVGASRTAAA